MKVLFIAYQYLFGNGGGEFAARAYINAFAEIADEMTLLYPMCNGGEATGINKSIRCIPVWDERPKIRRIIDFLIGRQNRFRNIEKLVGDDDYDVVVYSGGLLVEGTIDFFKRRGIKTITIHHNYDYEYFRDNTKFPMRIPQLFWISRIEGEAVRKSDLNITLTPSDKELLKNHYAKGNEQFEVLGAFEYVRKEHPIYTDVEEPKFLITGSLGAMQTENSLLPWMDEYYPILKEVFPAATLTLAGKNPSEKLKEKASRLGIEVIPNPESMQPVLAKAKYYICATALGGGLKLRVMDGLSAGLPVICHEVSARGYEAFAQKGLLLVYNDRDSFQKQLEILKTKSFDKKLTVDLYEQLFSFEEGKQRLVGLLKRNNLI